MTKKPILLFLSFLIVYGCSTSSDGNTTVVPIAPSDLTGTVASTTQINLSWTDNSTNETGFKIERKTGTGTYVVVGTTVTNVTTYNDIGITPNTTYTYRVYSNNAVGNSLTYSNELTLSTASFASVTDIDGNTYPLVTICNQTWSKINLKVSKYRNGDIIPQVTDATQWANLTTGAWCYYANLNANGITYGKLYNWYAVNDPRGLAPVGYHIPTDAEWTTLTTCLGGIYVAGGAMKETGTTHWASPNTNATNSSYFTGLPGGYRITDGTFNGIGILSYLWSSSQFISSTAWSRSLSSGGGGCFRPDAIKSNGLSIRFLKD